MFRDVTNSKNSAHVRNNFAPVQMTFTDHEALAKAIFSKQHKYFSNVFMANCPDHLVTGIASNECVVWFSFPYEIIGRPTPSWDNLTVPISRHTPFHKFPESDIVHHVTIGFKKPEIIEAEQLEQSHFHQAFFTNLYYPNKLNFIFGFEHHQYSRFIFINGPVAALQPTKEYYTEALPKMFGAYSKNISAWDKLAAIAMSAILPVCEHAADIDFALHSCGII